MYGSQHDYDIGLDGLQSAPLQLFQEQWRGRPANFLQEFFHVCRSCCIPLIQQACCHLDNPLPVLVLLTYLGSGLF